MCFAGIEDKIADLVQKRRPAEPTVSKARVPEAQHEFEPEPVTRPITVLRPAQSISAGR